MNKTHWTATVESDTHDQRTPEASLWRRVILQAFIDATKDTNAINSPVARGRAEKEKREAIAFFTASFGVTATAFQDVCQAANLNANVIKARAKKAIDNGETFKYLSLENPGEFASVVSDENT